MFDFKAIAKTFACGLGLLVAAGPALAEEHRDLRFTFAVGGLFADFDTTSGKAEEYRDFSDGFSLDDLALELDPAGSPWSFALDGDHVTRRDENLHLAATRAGRFWLDAAFDRTPHLLYRDAAMIFSGEKGDYRLADGFRSALETLVSAPDSTTAATVRAALAELAQGKDLAVQRERSSLGLGFRVNTLVDLRIAAAREKRSGNDRVSAGTYIRRQAVASDPTSGANFFDRERVEARGIELPKPIDSTSDEAEIGSRFHGRSWLVDFGWQRASFDNDRSAVTWENPFEGGAPASSSTIGLDPTSDQEPPAPFGSSSNRGRFTRAQLALEPDNEFERAFVTGALSLPGHTRVNASFAAATTTQDQPFLPYTLNTAILFSVGPDGVAGTADDLRVADLATPVPDLAGEVKTTRLDLRASSRPLPQLSLRARYGKYDYDDRSRAISWPGYSSAGDSYFRRNVGKKDAAGNKILVNEVADYSRTAWSLGGAWRFGNLANLDLQYDSTEWEYEARQVDSTSEDALAVKLRLTPAEGVTARLTWLDASREFDGPYAVGLETSRVRAFDVWDRDRTRWGAELDWELGERTTLGFAYANWRDEYPGVVDLAPTASNPFPSQPYGLDESEDETISATLTYAAEGWSLSGSVGRDDAGWESTMVAKTSLTSDAIQFDPANRWVRTQDDQVTWASLNLDAQVAKDWKLVADLFYQKYEGHQRNVNPGTPTINSGVAYPFPTLSSDLFTGDLTLEWALSERLGFGLRYLYEPYRLDDFSWDIVQPYMQGTLQETGDTATSFRDMSAYRLYWMDATYSDYTANVVTLFARLKF